MDVDGVLASHVEQILPILERRYGLEIGHGEIRSWDFPVGDTSFGAIIRAEQRTPGFVLETPPVPVPFEAMRAPRSVASPGDRDWPPARDRSLDPSVAGALRDPLRRLREPPGRHEAPDHDEVRPPHRRLSAQPSELPREHRRPARSSSLAPGTGTSRGLEPHLESQRLTVARDWPGILSLVDRPGSALGRSVGDD